MDPVTPALRVKWMDRFLSVSPLLILVFIVVSGVIALILYHFYPDQLCNEDGGDGADAPKGKPFEDVGEQQDRQAATMTIQSKPRDLGYLSSTEQHEPERSVMTIGYSITAMLELVLFLRLHDYFCDTLEGWVLTLPGWQRYIIDSTTVIGIVSVLVLLITAIVPSCVSSALHYTTGIVGAAGSAIWSYSATILAWKTNRIPATLFVSRLALITLALILVVIIITFFFNPQGNTCDNYVLPILEYSSVGLLAVFMATWYYESSQWA